jgi:predicted HicB family RNase H-like nuclease
MLEYKGYKGQIDFDEDSNLIHGRIVNIYDVVNFQGKTAEDLKLAFEDSIDDYLDMCEEMGEDPNKPFSGKFLLRTDPEVHKSMFFAARKAGKSLNAFINSILKKHLGNDNTPGSE